MKNTRLIAFLFYITLCGFPGVGSVCRLFAHTTVSAKVALPYVEARGSFRSDLKWNYGAALSTQKLFPKLQLTLKTGNLSYSGSISKLNSPALSSLSSAFCPGSVRTNGLTAALPQYESFSSVQGYFFETIYKPNKILKQISFDALYKIDKDNNKDITFSALIKTASFKKVDISFCSTAGVYPYKKKNLTSWFTNEAYYSAGNHFCINNQISFSGTNFSSLFIAGTYQSPFGDFLNTWRTENIIKLKDFSFNLNCFYNKNEEVITSSAKTINPLLQISGGTQYKSTAGKKHPYQITTGINSQADINLNKTNHSFKTVGGIRCSGGDFSGVLSGTINLNLTKDAEGIKASFTGGALDASGSFYIKDLTAGLSGKFTFTPDSKKTKWTYSEKIGLNFEYEIPNGIVSFSNNNQIVFTQKTDDTKNKIAFTSSLNATVQFRFCTLRVHLEFQV